MKKCIFLIAILLTVSNHANAATISTGTLQYDNVAGVITDSATGTYYLGWDLAKDLNYAQTVTATTKGRFAEYHIATQTEGAAFAAAAGTFATGIADGSQFGNNYDEDFDYAFVLSDGDHDAGLLHSQYPPTKITHITSWASFDTSDQYSRTGNYKELTIGWLLVSDNNVSAVPIPAAAFMFAPALLGFLGLRRRSKQA